MPSVQDAGSPRRRGRVSTGPEVRTGPVGEFAYRLWELKKTAGDPSYDRMRTEFGALASKSALSAAARGHRLPSWETTWEFVRSLEVGVLGADVDGVRRRWRQQWENAAAMSDDRTEPIDAPEPATIKAPEEIAELPRPRPRRRLAVIGSAAATVLLVLGLVVIWPQLSSRPGSAPSLQAQSRDVTPAVPGDDSAFVDDVTVPDGTPVRRGEVFVKTWEIRNGGSVRWTDRYLRRDDPSAGTDSVDRQDGTDRMAGAAMSAAPSTTMGSPNSETTGSCSSVDRVPIPPTDPGQHVRISVAVRAPSIPGWCRVRWTMVDGQGHTVPPRQHALFFLVKVV
ncbi:NBR1-Ig-like domain-containing protein [Amycolatopsis pigmentata]|uniref:NBR1-Ig-like domain-containing protein n=1 Tax=Amycolatopsis pigmentata TaxID=450801 RepID=A0ABW5FZB9_9PSEU